MWRVEVEFKPIDEYDLHHTTSFHEGHQGAYLQARHMACCAGSLDIQVIAPDGSVGHEWSREDNRWHDHQPPPGGNNLGNNNGRVLATPDRQSEIPKDFVVREGGLEPPHG